MKVKALLFSLLALSLAGVAQAGVITFEADAAGFKANGFSSSGFPGVTFTDTAGAELEVNNFGSQSGNTKGLAVRTDFDGSQLRIDFAADVFNLALDFGNDDSAFVGGDVWALLSAYDGVTLVGQTFFKTNGNDIMDQSIAVAFAGGFDHAFFAYTNSSKQLLNLIEVVDNVAVDVPAPAALPLLSLGLAALGLRRSRRNS